MSDEFRTQVKVKEARDPVLYDYLSQFPVKDRAYNITKLMTLGLLVERGNIPSPYSKAVPGDFVDNAAVVNSSDDELLGAGLGDLFTM